MEKVTRLSNGLRPISFEPHFTANPKGSCLVKMGNTWVLATASVEEKLPPFMEKKGKGWVTAEYSMLPGSTHTRSRRDSRSGQAPGRTIEIQRLIGRSLRACVDQLKLGERTITIDCDVLQADGGTRVAAINGGFVALALAVKTLLKQGLIQSNPIKANVAGISLGFKGGHLVCDLDYDLDSSCEVDMNIVLLGQGQIVELQGTAERATFSSPQVLEMLAKAEEVTQYIAKLQNQAIEA